MNIEAEFIVARAMIYRSIEANCATAKVEIKEHAARAIDEIRVQVGWMNRSAGQIRRYARARG